MRQYYSNAEVTLTALNDEINDTNDIDIIEMLGKIQEPEPLAKRLTPMLANTIAEMKNDKAEMSLNQALYAIKSRGRSVPVDGFYSILGLVPYGDKVVPKYKGKLCKESELEKALLDVMKVAVENDEKGSTKVEGSAGKINSRSRNDRLFINFAEKNIELDLKLDSGKQEKSEGMIHYTILPSESQNFHKVEGGFEVEGGLYRKDVEIKLKGYRQEPIKVSLLGTREALELAKSDCSLVVLYKEAFKTDKLFALLLEKTENENVYHRLGLVEVGDNGKIKIDDELSKYLTKTIIGINSSQINLEIAQEAKLQAQIQIEPKGNN
ncbi:10038_t:CDS:2 [Ambispora gerdemannii]|uniref:10038_t:CDS:1 n=1 Tax=Ambispora gerdemannii TaxID=144530 RepID=A0A9N9DFY5_9GLOM|nr:10038_t:CDS:2 [Ambispora gerdemannii]